MLFPWQVVDNLNLRSGTGAGTTVKTNGISLPIVSLTSSIFGCEPTLKLNKRQKLVPIFPPSEPQVPFTRKVDCPFFRRLKSKILHPINPPCALSRHGKKTGPEHVDE